MEYISLYRKYRPTSFNDVVGQKPIIKTLLNSIQQGKIAHAYIFSGSKGIGKTSIAKILAKAINCTNSKSGDACNECETCKLINNNQVTDIVELDAASNNGVEEVRKIIESVAFLPVQLKYKVYIIDEAHMLTTSAWNALLKTIEEPPHHVIFIFATTEINKIPATILSRCQNFQFARMTDNDANEIISKVVKVENIKINQECINKIIQLGNGSARDLLSILDQLCLYTNNNITIDSINEIFGLVDTENKISLINKILQGNLNLIINEVNNFSEKGINFTILTSDIISILLDKLIYLQTNSFNNLSILNSSNINTINVDQNKLVSLINIWQKIYIQIKTANDAKSIFMIGLFETLDLKDNVATIIPQQKKQTLSKQETNAVTKTEELKPIFKFSVLQPTNQQVKNHKEKIIEQSVTETKQELSLKEIFMHIAKNTSKAIRENTNKIIDTIKNYDELPACFNPLLVSKQVVVSSNNGVVLLFENEADAFMMNKNYLSPSFQKQIVNFFNHPMYFVGFTIKEINDLIKELKQDKSKLPDLDLSKLNSIIEDNSSLTSLAKKLFGGGNK